MTVTSELSSQINTPIQELRTKNSSPHAVYAEQHGFLVLRFSFSVVCGCSARGLKGNLKF